MQKIIEIEEGRSLNFKASAFSPIVYNKLFPGRDFIRDMDSLKGTHDEDNDRFKMSDYEQFVRIAYTFAYQGLAPTPKPTDEQKEFIKQYPDAWEWIDSFDTFSIYKILPEIIELWYKNEKTVSEAKNPVPAPPVK